MFTVQKIRTAPFVQLGLIEYDGPPEDLGEWLEALDDEPYIAETGLIGWGNYGRVVWLYDVDGSRICYLVPDIYFVGDGDDVLYAAPNEVEAQRYADAYNAHRDTGCVEAGVYAVSADELLDMPGELYKMRELGLL